MQSHAPRDVAHPFAQPLYTVEAPAFGPVGAILSLGVTTFVFN